MHRLLERQLKRYFGKDVDVTSMSLEVQNLIYDVSDTYYEMYEEKKLLEHTIDINSEELESANKKIQEQNVMLQKTVEVTSNENEEMINLLKQYKHAIDTSLIVSITDPKGRIKYVNNNFCEISGYSKEELLGKEHNIVRHPDNPKYIFEDMWKTLHEKKVWQGSFPNLAKNGTTYYVNATIIPLLNTNNEIIEYMALREDITEQVLFQKQLESEKERVSQIFNSQESIIVLFDRESGVSDVNQKFFEIFGFENIDDFKSKHECVCELFEIREGFLKPSTQDHFWAQDILNTPSDVHMAKIGEKVYSVKVSEIVIDSHKSYLSTFTDITDIEEARKKSQEAEQQKARFLANMSHEIRTPMNAISGFAQLLANTTLDPKQYRYVNLINSSSLNLIEIINDILDFSKLESGETEVEYIQVNPFMEFEDTFLLLYQRAKEKMLSYMINIDSNLGECIEIDSFHIKQVMTNLIGNAIKFTPEHGTIDIQINRIDDKIRFSVQDTGIGIPEDRQALIFQPFSQADNSTTRKFGGTGLGLSISKNLVEIMGSKLNLKSVEGKGSKFYFDLDYRCCDTTKTLKSSLSDFEVYVYDSNDDTFLNIIKQLGSYGVNFKIFDGYEANLDNDKCILISSSKNAISEYKKANIITLGANKSTTDEHIHAIENFSEFPSILYNELMRMNIIKYELSNVELQEINLKVLIAEDYEINQVLIRELMMKYNIDYEIVNNGQEAIDELKKNKYDLILMDINMPIMNGIEATKILINELKITTPIVALTANALDGDKEEFLALGMADYLSKPIDTKLFEKVLYKYANQSLKEKKHSPEIEKFDIHKSLQDASKKMHLPDTVIHKIFQSFQSSASESIEKVEKAISEKSFYDIQSFAHNLKSTSATFCFESLAKIAQELESESKNKNDSYDYEGKLGLIKEYIEKVLNYKD